MFFFFKQKTAYEMRISDWSSDVCSSDLQIRSPIHVAPPARHAHLPSSAVSHRKTKRRKNLPLPRGLHLHSGELPRERGIIGDGPVRQRRFACRYRLRRLAAAQVQHHLRRKREAVSAKAGIDSALEPRPCVGRPAQLAPGPPTPEARRAGKACVRKCSSRW